MNKKAAIKVYHGFGHMHDITLFGHVFNHPPKYIASHSASPLKNMLRVLRLFCVKPLAGVPVRLTWQEQQLEATTEADGFFRFEWVSDHETPAGWHAVTVGPAGNEMQPAGAKGEIFIPHLTQFAFISDIDDTIMVSYSATKVKRLKELLFKNPHAREIFPGVTEHYRLLSQAHTTPEAPNPFFYVSSSEWNLYDYLGDVFRHKGLPEGAFLLSQVKRWYQLWKTGKTKHEAKLLRIARLFELFPRQRFVLMGDNSQRDPVIYSELAKKYHHRIHAVYIRMVDKDKAADASARLAEIGMRGIHTLLFDHSETAIGHSKKIGLIPAP